MSTYTAIHLQSTGVTHIQQLCQDWLAEKHPRASISVRRGAFPLKAFARVFTDNLPSLLALGLTEPEWTTVHYNSFTKLDDLAARLSDRLACQAVIVVAQTVSDYYLISVYAGGERLRTLEFTADEGWLAREGAPLPFEQLPLGKNIAEPGETPLYFFGETEAWDYCHELGFSPCSPEYEPEWIVLQARKKRWLFG
jgi:hypothetical protein